MQMPDPKTNNLRGRSRSRIYGLRDHSASSLPPIQQGTDRSDLASESSLKTLRIDPSPIKQQQELQSFRGAANPYRDFIPKQIKLRNRGPEIPKAQSQVPPIFSTNHFGSVKALRLKPHQPSGLDFRTERRADRNRKLDESQSPITRRPPDYQNNDDLAHLDEPNSYREEEPRVDIKVIEKQRKRQIE